MQIQANSASINIMPCLDTLYLVNDMWYTPLLFSHCLFNFDSQFWKTWWEKTRSAWLNDKMWPDKMEERNVQLPVVLMIFCLIFPWVSVLSAVVSREGLLHWAWTRLHGVQLTWRVGGHQGLGHEEKHLWQYRRHGKESHNQDFTINKKQMINSDRNGNIVFIGKLVSALGSVIRLWICMICLLKQKKTTGLIRLC